MTSDLCVLVRSDCTAKVKDVVILTIYWKELVTAPIPFPKETGCERLQKLIDPTRNSKPETTVNVRNEGKKAE